ncbi:uncharacterized protein [Primulina huaijiensis]|uniref:uncharacterized protein n=1 Tax=Primulina huaijiensis TaxID=1492673 RepID=UPI003CC79A91
MYNYQRRSTASSILDAFSLNPLPYPVLLILALIFVFLGLQWYVSYESVVESTEENMGWVLMAVPLVLVFSVKWLSSFENPGWWFYGRSPWERQQMGSYLMPSEGGSSPWGVAAVIVLLLVLMRYQSTFLDGWFI